jgi:flavin-dependent dehydrogenase
LGLGNSLGNSRGRNPRFAFRRHYQVHPWAEFMELHWGQNCQIYVTPVSREEVCVVLVSSNPKLRLDDALGEFPELSENLGNAGYSSSERGAITVTRRLRRVYRDRTLLVGDASGGVDAITGEGLCLTFRQAAALADCLADGNLAQYQKQHRALGRRPAAMSRMMLFMAKHGGLRRRAMRVFESNPRVFAGMLALHLGDGSARKHVGSGIALGWELLTG